MVLSLSLQLKMSGMMEVKMDKGLLGTEGTLFLLLYLVSLIAVGIVGLLKSKEKTMYLVLMTFQQFLLQDFLFF